jgi:fumarate reductase subunit C
MAIRRTYVRPMAGWWMRNTYFMRYMAREVTAFFVAAYALVLLAGLARLSQGHDAFEQWLDGLRSPWSIAFHVLLLAIFVYHTYSWFTIMPKTMAPVVVGGKRLSDAAITGLGLAASAVTGIAFFILLKVLAA